MIINNLKRVKMKNILPTVIVIVMLSILPFCEAGCVIVGSPNGHPPKKLSKPAPPFLIKDNPACPYYKNSYGCCSELQIQQLEQNFQDIDMIFGDDCPICAVNQKIFWCEFTCSPNQSDFSNIFHF